MEPLGSNSSSNPWRVGLLGEGPEGGVLGEEEVGGEVEVAEAVEGEAEETFGGVDPTMDLA